MDDSTKTAPRAPVSPEAAALHLSHVQIGAVVEMFTRSVRTITDGRWEPSSDIPALGKLALIAALVFAGAGFGVRELAEAYLTIHGAG